MLQFLVSRLTGWRPDPTRAWQIGHVSTLPVDIGRRSVGPLRFGDPIEYARGFGRPDHFQWIGGDYCELIYARAGFDICFDGSRFAFGSFYLVPDPCIPDARGLRFASVQLDGWSISRDTELEHVYSRLGRPVSEDRDEDEVVARIIKDGLTLEFEATLSGYLKRLNLFPEESSS